MVNYVLCPHCQKRTEVEKTTHYQQTLYCPECSRSLPSALYFAAGGKSDWICGVCGGRPCVCD